MKRFAILYVVVCFTLCRGLFAMEWIEERFDENGIRTRLVRDDGGERNWLFLPGGPGGDSCYFMSLIEGLELDGKVWLVDLPGNGTNAVEDIDYESWMEIFPGFVKNFEHVVIVGHSFGGMLPLFFPEMEDCLEGFVIMNSMSRFDYKMVTEYAAQFDVPDLTAEMAALAENPCQETFDAALEANLPYYFSPEWLERGRELLNGVTFQYKAPSWFATRCFERGYSAEWIPQKVPVLIIGGKYDCICPYTIFQSDERFQRDNIEWALFEKSGHVPWLESPAEVKEAFDHFHEKITL